MIGWFYGISTLVGVFYAEDSLLIMFSNCLRYKNVYSNLLKRVKSSYLFAILIYLIILLNIISNRPIWPFDWTPIGPFRIKVESAIVAPPNVVLCHNRTLWLGNRSISFFVLFTRWLFEILHVWNVIFAINRLKVEGCWVLWHINLL